LHEKNDGTKEKVVGGVGLVLGAGFAILTGGVGGIIIGAAYGAASGCCLAKGSDLADKSKAEVEKSKAELLNIDRDIEIFKKEANHIQGLQMRWEDFFKKLFVEAKGFLEGLADTLEIYESHLKHSLKDLQEGQLKKNFILKKKWENFIKNWNEIAEGANYYIQNK